MQWSKNTHNDSQRATISDNETQWIVISHIEPNKLNCQVVIRHSQSQ